MTLQFGSTANPVYRRFLCEHLASKSRVLGLSYQDDQVSLHAILTCTDKVLANEIAESLNLVCHHGLHDRLAEGIKALEARLPSAPAASLRQVVGAILASTPESRRRPRRVLAEDAIAEEDLADDDDDEEEDEDDDSPRFSAISPDDLERLRAKIETLQFDLDEIELSYESRDRITMPGPSEYWGVDHWHVTAMATPLDEDRPPTVIGHIEITTVDTFECENPWMALDAISSDHEKIGSAVFEPKTGEVRDDLDVEGMGNNVLIIDRIELAPELRGHGIGMLLAGIAIKKLGHDAQLAACFPAPIGLARTDPTYRDTQTKLERTWQMLGFVPANGIHVLDLCLAKFEHSLEDLQQLFGIDY